LLGARLREGVDFRLELSHDFRRKLSHSIVA
jgi:hypothetical protein